MAEAEAEKSSRPKSPAIPPVLVVIALVVAASAAGALIYVLSQKTTGPDEVARQYYEAVAAGDCDDAYGLLSVKLRSRVKREFFCQTVDAVQGRVPGDITIKSVTSFGDPPPQISTVVIQEEGPNELSQTITWKLVREGHDWRVAQFPPDPRCEGHGPIRHCVPI